MSKIADMVQELPPDLQQEVEDYVQFLLEKKVRKHKGRMKLDWRGALSDMKDEYTSVELQHKALDYLASVTTLSLSSSISARR